MPVVVRKTDKTNEPKQFIHVDDDHGESDRDQTLPLDARFNRDPLITTESLEVTSIESIKTGRKQAKKHPERQIAKIARSIADFGFNDPIEVDENYYIISGYGRYLAAKRLGLKEVPVIRYSHLSESRKRAYAIAANKIAEDSEWDTAVLIEDFELFSDPEFSIDPKSTGFETVEIDQICCNLDDGGTEDPADQTEAVDPGRQGVTKSGEMWLLDQHILLCADAVLCVDALQEDSLGKLMGFESADLLFTDIHCELPDAWHISKRDGFQELEVTQAEISRSQLIGYLTAVCNSIRQYLKPDAVAYMCMMDHQHLLEFRSAADAVFGLPKDMVVWVKPNSGTGSFYRSQYELILIYAVGGRSTRNFGRGSKGRHRSNVWSPGPVNSNPAEDEKLDRHPAVKPVAIIEDALQDCSNRGDIVLDPFGGSGSTLIAVERIGRKARLIVNDPLCCDSIIRRWQRLTGKTACLANSHETFEKVGVLRRAANEGGGDE